MNSQVSSLHVYAQDKPMQNMRRVDLRKNKRVFVGISGGVDSSVSAALLKRAGFDVTGVFIKAWQPDWIECTWKEERRDAMRVAAHLGIPFVTLDLEKKYKKDVVDYMISEYRAGKTPNPDVMCNKQIKFGAFYNWAIKNGADFVATGHYARIGINPLSNELVHLMMGTDKNKDQSYFLWTLKKEQLPRILFPIGHLTKPEVHKLANELKLPTADKKDSQGLCFIGMVDMKDFLSHYIPQKDGDVLNVSGKIIGKHKGAFLFTIGERHGFTITNKSPDDQPFFVISKDVLANTITVANKTIEGDLPQAKTRIILKETNWNQDVPPSGRKLMARSRYRADLQDITLIDHQTIKFARSQDTLSSGQSLVVYDGEVCLGGGVIE